MNEEYLESAKELVANKELFDSMQTAGDELLEFAMLTIEIVRISCKRANDFRKAFTLAKWLWQCVEETYPEWKARLRNRLIKRALNMLTYYALKERLEKWKH